MRRPVPHRADTIGPWLTNLGFLTGLGSINTAALIFLFSGEVDSESIMWRMRSWGFLATIIASEQIYFGVREFVRYGIRQLESKGLLQERRAQFSARKEFLERVMKVKVSDETPTRKKSKKARRRDAEVQKSTICQKSQTEDQSLNKRKGLDRCLEMGLDIMRQEAPQGKTK